MVRAWTPGRSGKVGLAKIPKSVQVVTDNTKTLEKALNEFMKQDVYMGIPSTKADRNAGEPINNAVIGYVMERGMPEMNVPARPWLVPGVQAASADITPIFRKAGKNVLNGRYEDAERGLQAAGLVAQGHIKAGITAGIAPELAASTLAERKRQGYKGETPLIRSGQLLNSVSYVVRDRK